MVRPFLDLRHMLQVICVCVDATRVLSAAVMGNRFKCVDALLELGVPSDTLLETLGKHLHYPGEAP